MTIALGWFAWLVIGLDPLPRPPMAPRVVNLSLPKALWVAMESSEETRLVYMMAAGKGSERYEPPWYESLQMHWNNPEWVGQPNHPGLPATTPIPSLVAPVDPHADRDLFRAQVAGLLRRVEEQYWAFWREEARVAALERAVELGEESMRRGPGAKGDEEALERLRRRRDAARAVRSAAERRLISVLSLPDTEDIHLIASDTPPDEPGTVDRDNCLAQMTERRPEITWQRRRVAEARDRLAQTRLLDSLEGGGRAVSHGDDEGPGRKAEQALRREHERLETIIGESTREVFVAARAVEASSRGLRAAERAREAAARGAWRAHGEWRRGSASLESFLASLDAWADAAASEADLRARASTSRVGLEAAKGTLLDLANVAVAKPPVRVDPIAAALGGRPMAAHAPVRVER